MSTVANWVGLGVHGAAFLASLFFFKPAPGSFESDLGWGLTTLGFLSNVPRFLGEALKFGRWPQAPASYATNWIRYVGAGAGTTFFLGALAALSRGGVMQFLATVMGVLFYYAMLTFAALSFETNEAVIGFYTLAAFAFVATTVLFFKLNSSANKTYGMWVPIISWVLEAGFLAMAGIEVFKRSTADNSTEDIIFATLSIVKGVWALIVYKGGVKMTYLELMMSDDVPVTAYAGSTTYLASGSTSVQQTSYSAGSSAGYFGY